MAKPIHYTPKQLAFIKANCSMMRSSLTAAVNAKFKTNFSVDNIKSLCTRNKWSTGRDCRFGEGHQAWNKGLKIDTGPNSGSFKKGQLPHNYKPVGSERIHSNGYKERKMTDTGYPPDDWVAIHRLLWEEYNGPIQKNHFVNFIDGDKTNVVIENLIMVSRGEHAVINKQGFRNLPPEMKLSGIRLGQLIQRTARRIRTNEAIP